MSKLYPVNRYNRERVNLAKSNLGGGKPPVIGHLTDDEIAEFYKRYACEGYAKQVFGDIAGAMRAGKGKSAGDVRR